MERPSPGPVFDVVPIPASRRGFATCGRGCCADPHDVAVLLRLHALGWGSKRIAAEVGCARNTVKRYLAQGGWGPGGRPPRPGRLAAYADWITAQFYQHRGNADVVRQELARVHGVDASLRAVERAVAPLRQVLRAEARATVRFERAPGEQLQIDFGERRVVLDGVPERLYFFVATLGYSRRCHVRVFRHERQTAWFKGLERTFHAFGGMPVTVLVDNTKPLVLTARGAQPCRRSSTRASSRSRSTGASGRLRARRIGPGPRGRTSAAWAT